MCTALAQGCGSSGMVLAMHHIQVACIARHGMSSPFFRKYLRGAGRAPALDRVDHVGGRRLGRHPVEHLRRAIRQDGRFTLDKDATTASYAEQADDLAGHGAPERGGAAERSGAGAGAQGRSTRSTQTGTWDTLGMRGTCSPGFKLTVRGARGADPARLVRRLLGADDGVVLAHPVVGGVAGHRQRRHGARGRVRARRGAQDPGHGAAQGDAPGEDVDAGAGAAQQRARPGQRVRRDHVAPDRDGGAAHPRLGAQDEQPQDLVIGDDAADRARRAADHRHRRLQERLQAFAWAGSTATRCRRR